MMRDPIESWLREVDRLREQQLQSLVTGWEFEKNLKALVEWPEGPLAAV